MAIHKLQLDDIYEDEQFTLFGIHCNIEDYRLAYLLNKALSINLYRKSSDVDAEDSKVSYAIYEWIDTHKSTTWNLVKNSCKIEEYQENVDNSELPLISKITKTYYLMPELKKVNYLLKVNDVITNAKQKIIVESMQNISQIITVYTIQSQYIKSQHNLIFN